LAVKEGAARWSARPGVTFFHDDVSLDNLVPVDPLQSAKKIGTFPCLGALGRWRGGKQGDNDAAFADANRLTLFHPIQDTSKVMPQLSNCSCLHVQQRCYTFSDLSTLNHSSPRDNERNENFNKANSIQTERRTSWSSELMRNTLIVVRPAAVLPRRYIPCHAI
jgi:hypothetical protein